MQLKINMNAKVDVYLFVVTFVCDAIFEIDDVDVFNATDFGELGY